MPEAKCENRKCRAIIESGSLVELIKKLSNHYWYGSIDQYGHHLCARFIIDGDETHMIVFAGTMWAESKNGEIVDYGFPSLPSLG